jgi:hypothetical protein
MGKAIGAVSKIVGGAGGGLGGLGSFLGPAGGLLSAVSGAQGLFGSNDKKQAPVKAAQAKPFQAFRPNEIGLPGSLGDLSSFDQSQQRSALATRGLNQGLGADEDSYYKNLIQRSLIGEGNQVDKSNPNFLMPIESQYFSQKGLNTSDIMKFLQGLGR